MWNVPPQPCLGRCSLATLDDKMWYNCPVLVVIAVRQLTHSLVMMAHACWGDKGHGEIPHEQVAQVRDREAKAAATVIGADLMVLGVPKERGNHAI
jgi:hypothetical protein